MQRLALLASLFLTIPALAQAPASPPAEEKKAETPAKPADEKKDAEKKDAETPPALPGDVATEKKAADDAGTPAATPEPSSKDADMAAMRAQLKEEITAELRDQIQAEIETAARDAANQRAAQLEWEEERWVEEVKPRLNFLEFDGYFRTRFDFFNNLHLGTFDPLASRGTSAIAPPTMYRPFDGDPGCVDGEFSGLPCVSAEDGGNPADTAGLTSMNMRLRLDPTLNVSEDIRIRSTMDIFDNLVLGSTPESRPGFANNPTLPLPLFAATQLPPEGGFNTPYDAIRIKRLWAEIMTPFGQLRLGRQPQNWGLGVLVNDGNGIDADYGDQADQVIFATRAFGHYVVPGYSISSSGAFGRGGGAGNGGDGALGFYQGEQGQRFNLDPSDDVHTFILTIVKKDKQEDIEARLREGDWVLNYGVFGVYRTQQFDIPSYYSELFPSEPAAQANILNYVRRNATAGVASLWAQFRWDKLRLETEAVGLIANIDGSSTSSNGLEAVDDALQVLEDGNLVNKPIFVLQGGLAFESEYSMFNDSLSIGLDFGLASGDDAPGFGLRPVIKQEPEAGDFDGKQYGECLENNGPNGECTEVDNTITNFKFDPGYNVDLILFREVIGTVTDALYVKPHITYRVTEDLGIRGDFMWANALVRASTPGLQFPLGIELDGTAWYRSDDGFFLMLQGGVMIPLAGLNHGRVDPDDANSDLRTFRDGTQVDARFATATTAWTLQAFAGVEF
jgi:uncharacterized protein (TIGR04551 family)